MKAALPACTIQVIAGAISSHTSMATRPLSNDSTRDVFLTVVYELLKRDAGAELLSETRKIRNQTSSKTLRVKVNSLAVDE